ncbi:carbonic anhydrase [Fimicolochytrium jonesii]|uniref:carbonic anhydrase n=1 Tax=Fimicolochytrium jonesii TaxID=1396493 RepID=UPI0022FF0772|nr:carbonic anhydrase [Fimicolochytrium jonesii]KAI8818822.1 carbonic anhydrase [Fimicolochytrium jonesii]
MKPPPSAEAYPAERPLSIEKLLENNKEWAEAIALERPTFFTDLAQQQSPELLWIGCSDSRVPANQLLKLLPGDVFVHRNIGNILHSSDLNALSVIQYAVDVLKVTHIVVCGHYGCGGVAAALSHTQFGLVDHWIQVVKDMYSANESTLRHLSKEDRLDRMVEMNVERSVDVVAHSPVVQNAWARGQKVEIHGWVYRLTDGRLRDLGIRREGKRDVGSVHRLNKKKEP